MHLSMSRRTANFIHCQETVLQSFSDHNYFPTYPNVQNFFLKFLFSIEYSPKLNNLLLPAVQILNYLDITTPFTDSSVDKESAYNAGDPSSIPGYGRSAGDGISYPLQYSGASLVAQLIKNLPAMRETFPGLGRSPGEWEGYPLQYSGLENAMDCIVHGVAKSRT